MTRVNAHLSALSFVLFLSGCAKLAEEELHQRAKTALSEKKFEQALHHYQKLYREYPDSPHRADVLHANATLTQSVRKDYPQAIAFYRELIEVFPQHPKAPSSLFAIGFIYHNDLGNLDSARATYEEFIQRFPESDMSSSAKFELDHLGKNPEDVLSAAMEKESPPKKKPVRK
jgi:TolA-binding protein